MRNRLRGTRISKRMQARVVEAPVGKADTKMVMKQLFLKAVCRPYKPEVAR